MVKKYLAVFSLLYFLCLTACGTGGVTTENPAAVSAEAEKTMTAASAASGESETETAIRPETEKRAADLEALADLRANETGEMKALRAYEELLCENATDILDYDWQRYDEDTRQVLLTDIAGDGLPELLYIACEDNEFTKLTKLYIYACSDGGAKLLFSDYWDSMAGGGFLYQLFRVKGAKTLYAYIETGDECWIRSFVRFDEAADGSLERNEICRYESDTVWDEAGNSWPAERYYTGGNEADEAAYKAAAEAMTGSIDEVLMSVSTVTLPEMAAVIDDKGLTAMTCFDARTMIGDKLSAPYRDSVTEILSGLSFTAIKEGTDAESEHYLTVGADGRYRYAEVRSGTLDEFSEEARGTELRYTAEESGTLVLSRALGPHIYQLRTGDVVADHVNIELSGEGMEGSFSIGEGSAYMASFGGQLGGSDMSVYLCLPGASVSEIPPYLDYMAPDGEAPVLEDYYLLTYLYEWDGGMKRLTDGEALPYSFHEADTGEGETSGEHVAPAADIQAGEGAADSEEQSSGEPADD